MEGTLGAAFMGPQVQFQQMLESDQRMQMAEMSKGAALRKQTAEAEGLEARNAQSAQLSNLFRNFKPKPGQPQSEVMTEMAALATQAGDSQLAQTLYHRSAQAELGEARQVSLAAQAAQRQSVANKRMMENFNQIFGGVKTERELADAKLYAMTQPGLDANDAEMIQGMTLDRVADMQVRLLSAKERADIALREAAERTKRFEAASRDNARKAAAGIAQQRADQKAEKDANASKDGGKDVGRPTSTEIRSARAWLSGQEAYKQIDSPEGQRAIAVDLAAKTRRIHQANRALSADEAMAKAWLEISSSGAIEDYTTMAGFGPQKKRYNPMGPNAKKPSATAATVVRTGKLNGRKVEQLSDGSVRYVD